MHGGMVSAQRDEGKENDTFEKAIENKRLDAARYCETLRHKNKNPSQINDL
jgi:hypothetical protein